MGFQDDHQLHDCHVHRPEPGRERLQARANRVLRHDELLVQRGLLGMDQPELLLHRPGVCGGRSRGPEPLREHPGQGADASGTRARPRGRGEIRPMTAPASTSPRVVKDYRGGMTLAEVAQKHPISRQWAFQLLARAGGGRSGHRRRTPPMTGGEAHQVGTRRVGGPWQPRMRRVHVRGQEEIRKRMVIHVATFNLGLLMRKRFRVGTPRGLHRAAPPQRKLCSIPAWQGCVHCFAPISRPFGPLRAFCGLSEALPGPIPGIRIVRDSAGRPPPPKSRRSAPSSFATGCCMGHGSNKRARPKDIRRQPRPSSGPRRRHRDGRGKPVLRCRRLPSSGARSGQEATGLRSERILEVVLLDGCSVYVRCSSSTNGMYVVDRRAKVDGGMDRWPEIVVAACHDHR